MVTRHVSPVEALRVALWVRRNCLNVPLFSQVIKNPAIRSESALFIWQPKVVIQ